MKKSVWTDEEGKTETVQNLIEKLFSYAMTIGVSDISHSLSPRRCFAVRRRYTKREGKSLYQSSKGYGRFGYCRCT